MNIDGISLIGVFISGLLAGIGIGRASLHKRLSKDKLNEGGRKHE